jgi:protein-S-isoprenylcysteine O-methyltransferase Ste14
MKPYFEINHAAGLVLLVAIPAWGMMELSQRSNVPQTRDGAIRVRSGGFWIGAVLCLIIGAAAVNLAPRLVPAAAIGPGAVAFAVGMVFLVGGLVLRGWSFKALGDYFTHTVMVTPDQPVIAKGPYRVLRHPSYTGILLASMGIGLASANWVAVAGVTLPTLMLLLYRIHVEEKALLTTVGDPYRTYAAQHKRLVPLIW